MTGWPPSRRHTRRVTAAPDRGYGETVTFLVVEDETPAALATVSRTTHVPARVNVREALIPVAVGDPSPTSQV